MFAAKIGSAFSWFSYHKHRRVREPVSAWQVQQMTLRGRKLSSTGHDCARGSCGNELHPFEKGLQAFGSRTCGTSASAGYLRSVSLQDPKKCARTNQQRIMHPRVPRRRMICLLSCLKPQYDSLSQHSSEHGEKEKLKDCQKRILLNVQ